MAAVDRIRAIVQERRANGFDPSWDNDAREAGPASRLELFEPFQLGTHAAIRAIWAIRDQANRFRHLALCGAFLAAEIDRLNGTTTEAEDLSAIRARRDEIVADYGGRLQTLSLADACRIIAAYATEEDESVKLQVWPLSRNVWNRERPATRLDELYHAAAVLWLLIEHLGG